jgi:TetR/AcrR family transcriptional regulator, fatty acid metabolism regulator protein
MALKEKDKSKHDKIIEGAIKVFARKGFYNAKVSEIAREANVADGTIYLYFKNKDDILISLFEEKVDVIIHRMQEELKKVDDPVDKIRTFVEHHMKLVKENKYLSEVIQIELRQSSKFMRRYLPVKFLEYLDLIGQIIEEGKRAGVIRQDVIPAVAKRAIFGALDEMSLYWVLTRKPKYSLEQSIEQISAFFIDGLRARNDPTQDLSPLRPAG